MDIAKAFTDILATHDMKNISVSLNPSCGAGYEWCASVQWDGFSRDGIGCAHGYGSTPHAALIHALEKAREGRTPQNDIVVPELQIEGIEA